MELAASRKLTLGHDATRSRFLIDPRTSRWLPYWDGITTVALCFTALVTPYEVAYLKPDNIVLFVINRVVDLAFGTDIVIQFFLSFPTADSSGTHWVLDLGAIARHYLRGWFLLCAIRFVACSLNQHDQCIAPLISTLRPHKRASTTSNGLH
eukprot:7377342-Prymnesium_polylepis.5